MRLKPYLKKNNDIMFYINDYDRNVSLGYGENIKVTKLTKAQKNLLNNFFETLNNTKPYIENFKKVSEHTEAQAKLYLDLELYITDIASVCGNKVDSDGAYILYKNNLYNMSDIK